ncbi:MAG: hypothetical protein JWQ40_2806 [Segetibacter sp.]|nr:hypothetical protein [Segetibacter sp.]
MDNSALRYIVTISLGIVTWAYCFFAFGQYGSNTAVWNQLMSIEKDTSLSTQQKLNEVLWLKKQFEDHKLRADSVYARILHRIGLFEYLLNNEVATKGSINFTLAAIKINRAGKKDNSITFCINSYTNLAKYYQSLHMYRSAITYFDSAIILRKQHYVPLIKEVSLMLDKAQMLYVTGDYEGAVQEIDVAIVKARTDKDSVILPRLFNQRAQSNILKGFIEEAEKDATEAGLLAKLFDNRTEVINSTLYKADIHIKRREFRKAMELYKQAIKERIKTEDYSQVADDYTDFGNFLLNDLRAYSGARDCYNKAITYAVRVNDFERLAKAHLNLEQCSFRQQQFKEAEFYCTAAFKDLNVTADNNIFSNPTAGKLSAVGNKELALFILGNKTELLLHQYKNTGDKKYLSACLQTTLVTDTLITKTRHEQSGEQSKLYWRNKTREFFTHAMEACYLANNVELAFYFMEKSRAVLLNDKLNELGASANLPPAEAAIEQGFKIVSVSEQQKLALLNSNETGYETQLSKVAQAKADLEHYIKSLEKKYPLYYQYKYADEVATTKELKKYLEKNKQAFVHYFINDTIAYIISITAAETKMTRLLKNDFSSRMFVDFLRICSNRSTLNNQYPDFASASYQLYKLLFQPLNIPAGRVIICPDNFVIPFEALCIDATGKDFLIKNYVFSYAYSARFLMKDYDLHEAKGDFIGFAPVSFKSYADIADLKPSGAALERSASYYTNKLLLTRSNATRNNFLDKASRYTVVNVFSHALADTTNPEPVLYMNDSVISLSELQLLHHAATKLVVLSACQTIVGRNAKGEGILSLARGFASAGIPSVAATLWQADEQTIYEISRKFHEYLSKGISKDEALQKAKLYFVQNSDKDRQLPYYWANLILVGNAEPLHLRGNNNQWFWAAGLAFTAIAVFIVGYYLKKRLAQDDLL